MFSLKVFPTQGWFRHRLKPFSALIGASVVMGLVSGLGTVYLLSLINQALVGEAGLAGGLLLAFAGLCAVTLLTRAGSDIATNLIGQKLVAEVRTWLGRKILSAPVEALERYKAHKILPVLTHDVDMISDAAFMATPLAISLVIVTGCFAYLAWLSWPLFLIVLVVLGVGMWIQFHARLIGIKGFEAARGCEDDLHRAYRTISEGAKELKVSRSRRRKVLQDEIAAPIAAIRAINARAINIFVVANAFGSALFFMVIALALIWHGLQPMELQVLSGFVLVLLFLKGPVDQLMNMLPTIGKAQIALRWVADLSTYLATSEPDVWDDDVDAASRASDRDASARIELDRVTYAFPAPEGAKSFALGPIDLTFQPGKITFIVGDNGSGKTTLIKLLLGLYAPQEGAIVVNGKAVTAATRDDYRQMFSIVLSDFHLFETVQTPSRLVQAEILSYLEKLELSDKVSVAGDRFTTTDLSTGQRKRLALIHVWLEERPVIVFDEWAADQDPTFRRVFYEELLPDLKRQGKTLIVISHDDRYFGIADRIVRLRAGQVVTDEPVARVALGEQA